MSNDTQNKRVTSAKGNRAASMSSLIAKKGEASPSSDVLPRGESGFKEESDALSGVGQGAAAEKLSTPLVVASVAAPVGTSSISELATMLSSLSTPTSEATTIQPPKVTINVKLEQSVEQKLKQIVGFEKMKRSSNFSQQDWLESRIRALVELEHGKLPKF